MKRALFAAAIGLVAAGAVEFVRTLRALGNLQFQPSVDSAASFTSWSTAMFWAPVAVIGSALLLALARSAPIERAVALLVTIVFAARVWENVDGYLIPNDAMPYEEHPLPLAQWPWMYRHPWIMIGVVALLTIAGVAYAGWRERPRLIVAVVGVVAVVALVVAGGQLGFANVSFLRLRNWSAAVAVVDVVVTIRNRDVAVLAALIAVVIAAVQLVLAWSAMRGEIPTTNAVPWW